ncbi:MAG TPA: hypothetical protein VFQ77_13555, partial [Pseudonocardiaceae bacterium]|nr:hypothetical protein [Pseudonocardiaceae bacterium]
MIPVDQAGAPLGPGPGMRRRAALAVPLATATVWIPLTVTLFERHVTALAEQAEPTAGRGDRIGSPLELLGTGHPWIWLTVAALLLVAWRRDPHRWTVPALLTAIPVPYVTHLVHRPGVAELDGIWGLIGNTPTGAVVAATAALTVGAARFGAHLLTSPLGADVAGSTLTVPLPSRGSAATLTLRHDRLMLATHPYELALPWPSITLVQAGALTHDTQWVQPHGRVVIVPAGPVLQVAGAEQQWMVPVADAVTARQLIETRRRARA